MGNLPVGTYSGELQIRAALNAIPDNKAWMRTRLENEIQTLSPNYVFSEDDVLEVTSGEITLILALPGKSGTLKIGVF